MKVIYLNKETGKEVHYGETLSFKETKDLGNGYKSESAYSIPLVNSTIPFLIEKGILVQKEVENNKEESPECKDLSEYGISEKIDILIAGLACLAEKLDSLESNLEDYFNMEDC